MKTYDEMRREREANELRGLLTMPDLNAREHLFERVILAMDKIEFLERRVEIAESRHACSTRQGRRQKAVELAIQMCGGRGDHLYLADMADKIEQLLHCE